ncbi:hypothetical protein Sango_2839700 [Sesamum angolense]|uniref:G-patch domain-containing protein n=1 Tax=Sesamum angolense TaxID=2727404 RepID=A0AAE1VX37_9LAMI|nr:hypothetical protein Sango_2839700 [Sesamum angolense]
MHLIGTLTWRPAQLTDGNIEQEFLSRFYSTRRTVSMVELQILANGKKSQSLIILIANLIDLPEMKRLEESRTKGRPKILQIPSLSGAAIQDCFVFKYKVMQLARQVNILPLRILKELEISIDELSNSRLMIQGFNQGGQRAVGIIEQLTMEDMVSSALFHVIDAKTSYNMLLGRPWLHENEVVPSTWHQCFKYYRDGIVKKRFVPSTQEEEGGHEALAIDEKGFDPKAFKLLIKAGYDPKEKLNLGKLPPEATGKKLHGLNATQIMLKEKGHAIQDSRVDPRGRKFERIRIQQTWPHRKELRGIANRQSVFDRVLKAKAQTVIFTQVQSDDEDDKESVASSNYISNSVEENIAQTYHITLIEDGEVEEEYAEDAPAELEEGIKATIDELKEVNLCDIEKPSTNFT